jgi:hypothetical protein
VLRSEIEKALEMAEVELNKCSNENIFFRFAVIHLKKNLFWLFKQLGLIRIYLLNKLDTLGESVSKLDESQQTLKQRYAIFQEKIQLNRGRNIISNLDLHLDILESKLRTEKIAPASLPGEKNSDIKKEQKTKLDSTKTLKDGTDAKVKRTSDLENNARYLFGDKKFTAQINAFEKIKSAKFEYFGDKKFGKSIISLNRFIWP